MSGDFSRFIFDPRQNYSAVLQQQGRIQLDSDWNEQSDIARRSFRVAVVDVLGRVFVATPGAFKIEKDGHGGLSIGRGRIYVDGLVAENHGAGRLTWDAALDEQHGAEPVPYTQQPYLPVAQTLPRSGGPYQVYLDVWLREVTSVVDPDLVDSALGGPDTTTRLQTVWQVRLTSAKAPPEKDCKFKPPAGRLSTDTGAGDYTRPENQLYRVEVHDGGKAGTATFKWSRDNASTVARVIRVIDPSHIVFHTAVEFDVVSGFASGGLVEVTDDARELDGLPGELRRIAAIDPAARTLTLDAPLSPGLAGQNGVPEPVRHMRVARWDGSGTIQRLGDRVALADGVAVRFDAEPADGCFRTGDYWVIAARADSASIAPLERAPPRGIHHHVVGLALFTPPQRLRDCREGVPRQAARRR